MQMYFNLPFCLSFSAKVIQLLKSLMSGWSFGSLLSPAKTQNNSAAKQWIIAEIDCELYTAIANVLPRFLNSFCVLA